MARTRRSTGKKGNVMNIVNAGLGGTVGTMLAGLLDDTVNAGPEISNAGILAAATAVQMTSKSETAKYMAAGAAGAAGAQLLGGLLAGITGGAGTGSGDQAQGFTLYPQKNVV